MDLGLSWAVLWLFHLLPLEAPGLKKTTTIMNPVSMNIKVPPVVNDGLILRGKYLDGFVRPVDQDTGRIEMESWKALKEIDYDSLKFPFQRLWR